MITEIAVLNITKEGSAEFEKAFAIAQHIISGSKGYLQHQLLKCLEEADKYLLIVHWETLEHHTEGFRKSAAYGEWKSLLHHFYHPFPVVEHYRKIF